MAVLALDLATTTGWALHSPGMQRPFFGALRFPSSDEKLGHALVKLDAFLTDQHRMHGLTAVVVEAQHIGRPGRVDPDTGKVRMGINPKTVKRLNALSGHVEFWVARENISRPAGSNKPEIEVWEAHIATWRNHFLGRPPYKGQWRKKDVKQAAIDVAARYGWFTEIADAAEACGILDYFLSLHSDHPRPWRDGNLFGGTMLL